MKPCCIVVLCVALSWARVVSAEEVSTEKPPVDESRLTLERIFGKNEFKAKRYAARWEDTGSRYVRWEKSAEGGQDLIAYRADNAEKTVLLASDELVPPGTTTPLTVDGYQWSKDMSQVLVFTNSQRVWRTNTRGDYWVLDRSSHELRKIGGDAPPSSLMFAKFSPAGDKVAYVHDNDIYVQDLFTDEIRQLTANNAAGTLIHGTFDWVYEEEFRLRDGFRWSPDGRRIAFWQLDTSGVRDFTLINNTDGLYPKLTQIKYPKVGQRNSACRVGVLEVSTGDKSWLNIPGEHRDNYIASLEWAPNDSSHVVIERLNRLQNQNKVMLINVDEGDAKIIMDEKDDAWVDVHHEMKWLRDDQRFTWVSERDGWRHIYLASRKSGEPRQLTQGEFDVIELLHVDEATGNVYFLASPENFTQQYLYRTDLSAAAPQRVTPQDQPGTHAYKISADGTWATHTYSSVGSPPTTELVALPSHEQGRILEDNEELRAKVEKLSTGEIEFLRVPIEDGVELDAWCLLPPDIDQSAKAKYPLLVYVYGEPAGQTVKDTWGGSGMLWHRMLAQQGYVVMSFDNRGTPAPRGRAWRKCVYRQVGVLAPKDQAAAVRRVLEDRPYLDSKRVGVWGWSGGGSMTLNAMFKFPDLYHTGISIAPVPNQRFYDTIYQERYMGLPGDNVEGFRAGSPINFAHQLKGNLLLVHGTGDDNCHYQGSEALINRLVRHNKQFSMMAYPNRSHSIREGKNTTLHLRQLMTSYLHRHLPADHPTSSGAEGERENRRAGS